VRDASTQVGHDPHFCWQHQKCKNQIDSLKKESKKKIPLKQTPRVVTQQTDQPVVDQPLVITFVEHDGSVIPRICQPGSDTKSTKMTNLYKYLTSNGVEILIDGPCFKIYTKLYSKKQMEKMGASGFHAGYNIRTFFEKFPELIKYIDVKSYDEIKFFLSEKETIDDLL